MTQEDKKLLFKDLCARLPYEVRVKISDNDILTEDSEKGTLDGKEIMSDDNFVIKCDKYSWILSCNDFKPYLRPMSSMTDEEAEDLRGWTNQLEDNWSCSDRVVDFLYSHHFDFHHLILKGLALEAPEDMYKTE